MAKKKQPAAQGFTESARPSKSSANVGRYNLRVIATRLGYYGHKRRKPGEAFTMSIRDGQSLPTWVKAATAVAAPTVEVPIDDIADDDTSAGDTDVI